ncbi:DUF4274 domain-containing protein [Paenibacillus hunanensis]|uniref:DUF4274 domain-containing protein n=1 Tax=Paenibacillus hunanensis TaxID=539262 RepID=UPI002A69E101|nr:DUF4274 domain-containing protein [Paenibacillus hunanensis]WPP41150.1 DUF4274 domain-containing protein [Paenibacillus hunanensis]
MNWKELCRSGTLEQLQLALQQSDVNERDERGRTPLMLCITNKRPVDQLSMLIEHGADLEARDKLGETALFKSVKFKQYAGLQLLVEAGAKLDHAQGLPHTAWYEAHRRGDITAAELLGNTPGAIRLRLTDEEQAIVDQVIYEESVEAACEIIRHIQTAAVLHAVVQSYNWDDSYAPMQTVAQHPLCQWLTHYLMFELLEGEYWLGMEQEEIDNRLDGRHWYELAVLLKQKLNREYRHS